MKAKVLSFVLLACGTLACAQQPGLAGDYAGMLGPYHVRLHLVAGSNGALSGTADNVDTGLMGAPCTDIHVNGQALSLRIPSVNGTFSGIVSTDNASISGMWSQGTPMMITFTRVAAGSPAPAPGAVPPAGAGYSLAAAAAAGATDGCPMTSMANYWDGSGWKPLTQVVTLTPERGFSFKEAMKNPLSNSAGNTRIMEYKNTAAAITLSSTPRFCFRTTPNSNPQFVFSTVDVKKDHREIELKNSDRSKETWLVPASRAIDGTVKRVSDSVIEVTLDKPLQAGQYIVVTTPSTMTYDFGVQ